MDSLKLLLDTNVVIDFLQAREPFFEKTYLLMEAGKLGEFELWVSSSQITDVVYILSNGGRASKLPETMQRLRALRTFINVYAVSADEVDCMLESDWKDPEDALLFAVANAMRADAIVTRNQKDFETSLIKVLDCNEFFAWLEEACGISYSEAAI